MVISSKYFSSLLFCSRALGFVVWSCCLVKRRLFSPLKRHFTIVEKIAYFKPGYPWFWSSVRNIFRAYFSVQETLVLSFDPIVLSKGGFLVHKYDILQLSRNLHILKRVNPWFSSSVPNIFRAYFSVQETLVLSFDHVVLLKGGFLLHKNDIIL